jgi:hypothetical protein
MQPPLTIFRQGIHGKRDEKFEDTGSWNLPVITNGEYIGFYIKIKCFILPGQLIDFGRINSYFVFTHRQSIIFEQI